MRKDSRNFLMVILGVLLVSIIGLSIAYALLSVTLNITGISEVAATGWDVHFEKVSSSISGVSYSVASSGTSVDFTTSLSLPGDSISLPLYVVNDGGIDAILAAEPIISGLTTSQDVYINYSVTYSDGTIIKSGDILQAGESTQILLTLEYDKDITASQLPTSQQTLSLSFSMNYVQD